MFIIWLVWLEVFLIGFSVIMEPIETSFRKPAEQEFTGIFEFAEVDSRMPANQRLSSGRTDCIIGKITDTAGVANAAGAWWPGQQVLQAGIY